MGIGRGQDSADFSGLLVRLEMFSCRAGLSPLSVEAPGIKRIFLRVTGTCCGGQQPGWGYSRLLGHSLCLWGQSTRISPLGLRAEHSFFPPCGLVITLLARGCQSMTTALGTQLPTERPEDHGHVKVSVRKPGHCR